MIRQFRHEWPRLIGHLRKGSEPNRPRLGATTGLRSMIVGTTLLIMPGLVSGQVFVDMVAPQTSNEEPGRPIQLPPASSEVKEAFDDFERFSRRGAWERAFKALDAIPDDQNSRFVDRDDGFVIRVSERRRGLLTTLAPEGREAYRLFANTEAERLLSQASGEGEQETLERLFANSFLTSVGDDAADRLGDLYFEQGRFDRAAECWLAILRDYPDSDLPPGQIAVKAALALHWAGRHPETEELRREIAGRYSVEEVTIAGETMAPEDYLRQVIDEQEASSSPAERGDERPVLGAEGRAAWQVRFGDSVVAGMSAQEREQWESSAFGTVVPDVATDGDRLFANYLGHLFAVDLESGKMLWRSTPFHNLNTIISQNQGRMLDPTRYAILAANGLVWSLERDLRDQNYNAMFRLVCRKADSGDVVWQSTDWPSSNQVDPIGPPLLAGDRLFVVARSQMNQPGGQRGPALFVLAIAPDSGEVLWQTELGALRQDQRYVYSGMMFRETQPQILLKSGALYVDTHAGVLARLDVETGDIAWGYAYETEPAQGGGRVFISSNQVPDPVTASGLPVEVAGAVVVKGLKSTRIAAIDPDRMTLLWDRPIARSTRLLGAIGETLLLGGPEIDALDLDSRRLRWSVRLPGGSFDGRPILRDDGIWHLTARGIFELDPNDGRVRRIIRGNDTGASGGNLLLTDRWLLAVSNRTISAYDRRLDADDLDQNDDDSRATDEGEE